MCLNDWKLGRQIKSVGSTVTLAALAASTIPPNQQRVGIRVALDFTALAALDALAVSVNGVNVGFVTVNTPFVQLTLANDGDLPTKAVTVTDNGPGSTAQITEFFLPETVLSGAPLGQL